MNEQNNTENIEQASALTPVDVSPHPANVQQPAFMNDPTQDYVETPNKVSWQSKLVTSFTLGYPLMLVIAGFVLFAIDDASGGGGGAGWLLMPLLLFMPLWALAVLLNVVLLISNIFKNPKTNSDALWVLLGGLATVASIAALGYFGLKYFLN